MGARASAAGAVGGLGAALAAGSAAVAVFAVRTAGSRQCAAIATGHTAQRRTAASAAGHDDPVRERGAPEADVRPAAAPATQVSTGPVAARAPDHDRVGLVRQHLDRDQYPPAQAAGAAAEASAAGGPDHPELGP